MALYQQYTFTNISTFLSNLATFASSNGWSVNTSTSTRVVIVKNGHAFRVEYVSPSQVRLYCTPSGGTENTSTIPVNDLSSGTQYMFISGGKSLFIGRVYGTYWLWGGFSEVVSKVGSWGGGCCLFGMSTGGAYLAASYPQYQTIFYNGGWSPVGSSFASGSLRGSIDMDTDLINGRQPTDLNGSILPIPVKLFIANSTTPATLFHPIGWLEDILRFSSGGIYSENDIISISGVDHLVKPYGGAIGTRDLLFKLGS